MTQPFDPTSLHAEFRDEARAQLNVLDRALAAAEKDGALEAEEATELHRALHTLKGNAGMLGFSAVSRFVHELEEVVRQPADTWTPRMEALLRGAALLRAAAIAAGTDDEEAAFTALAGHSLERDADVAPGSGVREADARAGAPVDRSGRAAAREAGPRLETDIPVVDPEADELAAAARSPLTRAGELVRVPFHRLDALLGGVGDLISHAASLRELLVNHREVLDECGVRRNLEEHASRADAVVEELRRTVMDLRLVPIGQLLNRFPSLAKDLAVKEGKSVRVEVEGEDTELDKSTLDGLAEPLLHLVRNSVAHGFEGPDERALQGKPAYGTLTLRARRVGEHVRIEVDDDGRGLDLAAIERRGREMGWVEAGDRPALSELTELILRPEFSTREDAGEDAGRGVGLHAVRRAVTELHGSLVVEPREVGTRFVISLPLRVMIVPSVLFESAGETLALPAADVVEAVRRPPEGDVPGLARIDGVTIPVRTLAGAFGAKEVDDVAQGAYLVIANGPAGPFGIPATALHDRQDLVVRGIPPFLGSIEGVSGAAVTPAGRVVLLLDPMHLPALVRRVKRAAARART